MSEKILNLLFPDFAEFNPIYIKKYCELKNAFYTFLSVDIPQWIQTIPKTQDFTPKTQKKDKIRVVLHEAGKTNQLDLIYQIIEKMVLLLSGNINSHQPNFSNPINISKPQLIWSHQDLIFVNTYHGVSGLSIANIFDDLPETNITSDLFIFTNFQDSFDRFHKFLEPDILKLPLSLQNTVKDIIHRMKSMLSEFEDWKTTYWEKPKQILQLSYVITLDRFAKLWKGSSMDYFLNLILTYTGYLKEWKELYGFTPHQKSDFYRDPKNPSALKPIPIDLTELPTLLSDQFFANLPGAISASLLDGMIIKSDNYHALNLLLAQFGNRIKTIFIDPPFNKETDLCDSVLRYKVDYSDSVWLSLLFPRIKLAKPLLQDDGSIFVRCDYAGNHLMRSLLNEIFGSENFRNEIVVRRGAPKASLFKQFKAIKSIGVIYDNVYWYSKHPESSFKPFMKNASENQQHGKWCSFKKIYDRPNLRYEILGVTLEKGQWMWNRERAMKAVENYQRFQQKNSSFMLDLEEYWTENGSNEEYIRRQKDSIQYWVAPREEVLCDNNWMDIPGYASGRRFKTENSEELLERIILSTSEPGDWVMDFFLGSGTTTAVAHKLGRKWIGVELGPQFDDVVVPRMKQVLFGVPTGITKDINWKGGGFFAYYRLEQFEDLLKGNPKRSRRSRRLVQEAEPEEEENLIDDTDENPENSINKSRFPDLFNLFVSKLS